MFIATYIIIVSLWFCVLHPTVPLEHTRTYWGCHNGQGALLAVFPFGIGTLNFFGVGGVLLWQSDITPPFLEWWTQAETMRAQSKTLLELLAVGGSPWGSYVGRCEPGAAKDYYMQIVHLEMRQTEPRRVWGERGSKIDVIFELVNPAEPIAT